MFPTVVREEVAEQARLIVNCTSCGFLVFLHFQLKVQLATGVAPWLQGGELPHACPPCSAAQRACSGGDFGKFGNFGKAYMVFSDL